MPELKLDSFEKDESNKFALALLGAVVQLEAGYSPLLIHGDRGSGKTHLLSALNAELTVAHPDISLLYIPQDFPIDKLLLSEEGGSNGGSREFIYEAYSRKDFLIVDDIERFIDDPKIRERFYELFDVFIDNAKQVVLTSSTTIDEMKGFNERFRGRLRGGIDARLSPPEPAGRLKILKRECDRLGLKLDVEMLQLLMKEAGKDIQYLKKLPSHIRTFSSLNRQALTKKKVEEFLAIIRAEAGRDKGEASSEQVYGSWIEAQAKKREQKLADRIRELEQRLSEQVQKSNDLTDELETTRSLQATATREGSDSADEILQLKRDLKEKEKAMKSGETAASKEAAGRAKELEDRDGVIEKLKADHAKKLGQMNSRLSELEDSLGRASEGMVEGEGRHKKAEAEIGELKAEIENLKKTGEDEVLQLRIQIENKDENLKLLREEREMRASQHEKEKAEAEQQTAELHNHNLLLERASEDLHEQIKELEKHLEQTKAELAGAVELRDSGAQEHGALAKQLKELRSRLKAESDRHAAEIKEKTRQERRLKDAFDSKGKEIESAARETEKQTKELQSSLDAVNEKLAKAEKSAAEAAENLDAAGKDKENLQSELASRDSAIEQLNAAKEAEVSDLQRIVSEKEGTLSGAGALEAELRAEMENLSNQLEGERSRSQSGEERSQELSERLSAMEADLASARSELEKAEEGRKAHLAKAEDLSSERDGLRELAASLEDRISELAKTSEDIEGTVAAKDSDIKGLTANLTDLQEKLDERERLSEEREKGTAETLGALQEELKEELKQRDGKLHEAQTRLAERTAQLESSGAEAEKFVAEVARLSEELIALREEKNNSEQQLSGTVQETSERLATAESRASDLQSKLDEGEARALQLTEQLAAARESLSAEIGAEKEISAALEKKLSETEESLEEERGNASMRIEGLTAKVSELEGLVKEQRESISADEKDSAARGAEYEKQLKDAGAESQKLSKQLADRERDIESKTKAESKLKEKVAALDGEFKAAADQLKELKGDAKAADKKLKQQERMVQGAKEQTARSTKLAKEKDRHIADLQRSLDSARKELAARSASGGERKFSPLEAELSGKEKVLAATRFDLAELQASHDELSKRAAEAREKIDELGAEKADGEKELETYREKIKRLEAGAGGSDEDAEQREQALARIAELEKTIREKDKSAITKEDIDELKSKHGEVTKSLKDQVKEAMKELARAREASEEKMRELREEADAARRELAQAEARSAAPPAESKKARAAAPEQTPEESPADELEPAVEPELAEPNADVVEKIREASGRIAWVGAFESFQATEANAFSVSMAEKIARNPGELYNPLCIYGPSGSGKTHVLHSVGDLSTSEDPDLTCSLLSVDSLLEIVQAEESTVASWVTTVKLLIIDDFQISNVSPELQEKLYEFLAAMAEREAQIVISSQEPPIRMNYLQEYFLRFLEGGLLARLEPHPDILEAQKEAAEAVASAAMAMVAPPRAEPVPGEERPEDAGAEEQDPVTEPPRDFLDEFICSDASLTDSSFRGKRIFDELEEAFRYPNKKWKNKFPLLVIEEDEERRNHFFNALANRLKTVFDDPVALLSIAELAEMLALAPSFDWNGLLNKLGRSAVVLINGCEGIARLPDSATGYMQAIVEDIAKRDILLMIGMSKRYKKEPVFGTLFKKASRKKI